MSGRFAVIVSMAVLLAFPCVADAIADSDSSFRDRIQADWLTQELGKKRRPEDAEAIEDAYRRLECLLNDLRDMPERVDVSEEAEALQTLRQAIDGIANLNENDRLELYYTVRWLARSAALKNPLLGKARIAFLKRRRFICQMLHEYMGYYYDYGDVSGGGVHVLEEPGRSFKTMDLTRDRLPVGNYTTLALSYDATKFYFAFAERAPEKTDFYSPDRRCFQIFSMDSDGGGLRQLTSGMHDSFDPCELPGGDVVFMSTRRGGFIRCSGPWEPLLVYTLHRMKPDGSAIQTLSYHETNEWHPSVLNDGRVVYTRWDYVDRSAAHFHGLWVCNPDGSNARALFGNSTQRINACYQPRAIPGSDKIAFLAGAHHATVGGSLVLFDPAKAGLDAETGQDDFRSIETLTPEVCFPEAPGWPRSYYHSPWPLSEKYFLVSYSHDPLSGMGPNVDRDTETGIYLFDCFGNLELLYREEGISCMYPLSLHEREKPPVIPSTLETGLEDEGEFMVADINKSLYPLPASRPVRELRVFQILPKSETHIANQPRLGYANAESARMLLGTVPVEGDGSAYFRVPARKPLSLQAVDDEGRAVQGMRTVIYVQPGERRGCVGCHESTGVAMDPSTRPLAMQREPSVLEPGPDGSRPWSYPRLVQPILDRHCIGCHDGSGTDDEKRLDLRGARLGEFSVSYESLKPYARWYEWGEHSIEAIVTRPGNMPADVSPLTGILSEHVRGGRIDLSDRDRRTIYLWLDGNASFYGCFSDNERLAQRNGESIPAPTLH